MNDIICPNCKTAFKVDEAGFASILKQVRDRQFEEEIQKRLNLAAQEKDSAVKLAEASIKNSLQEQLAAKDRQLLELKAQKEVELSQKISQKDTELLALKARLDAIDLEKKLAITEATQKIEKQRDELMNALRMKETEQQLLEKSLQEKFASELRTKEDIIKLKDEEIALRKDMKLKLSTKMIGETLEQHCETEFNKLRATAFQNAYFEKDNEIGRAHV